MAFEYLLTLRDGLSAPAARMGAALRSLQGGLQAVQGAAVQAGAGLASMGVGSQVSSWLHGATGAGLLKDAIEGLAHAALGAAEALAHTLFEATSFREQALISLTASLGDAKSATQEFSAALQIAEHTKFTPDAIVNSLSRLSQVLTDVGQRRGFLGAITDLVSVKGKPGEDASAQLQEVSTAVEKVIAYGKITSKELLQLNNAGVGSNAVVTAIADNFGIKAKTQAELTEKVHKAIEQSDIKGDRATLALYDALRLARGKGNAGKLSGAVAEQNADTLAGLTSNIKRGLFTLFASQNTQDWPVMQSLISLLRQVSGLFSSTGEDGKRFGAAVRDIGTAFAPLFDLAGYELGRLKDGIIGNTVEAENFRRGLAGIAYGFTGVSAVVYGVYRIVAFALGGIVQLFGGAVALGEWLGDTVAQGVVALSDLAQHAWDWGTQIVQGLINGIRAGAGALADAVRNLASDAVAGIKGALKISSPSRVMADLGNFAALGFVGGLQQQDVAAVAEGLAQDASEGLSGVHGQSAGRAAGARVGGALGGGGGISVVVNFGDLVSQATDPAAVALEVQQRLGAELYDQIDAALQRWRQG